MAVFAVDRNGLVRSANRAAERFFGGEIASSGLQASSLIEGLTLTAADTPEIIKQFNRRSRDDGAGAHMTARRLSGDPVPVEVKVAGFTAVGEPFISLFVQDVTAVIRAEKAIQELRNEITHSWRLNALGEMASVLAHDLNQPLSAIANQLHAARSLLQTASPDIGRAITSMTAAEAQSQRAGETIRRMRALMSREIGDHADEEVLALVEDLMPILRTSGREFGARFIVDVLPDETAHCDRIQIQQVIGNLTRNAMEAGPRVGARSIAIRGRADPADGCYRLTVEDDGPGIPAEVSHTLFEPWASTKKNGLGLGLSICRTIVEAHGGSLSCSSGSLGGAAFSFSLRTDRRKAA